MLPHGFFTRTFLLWNLIPTVGTWLGFGRKRHASTTSLTYLLFNVIWISIFGFDLSQVKYDIDAKNKILTITNIPNEEIKISPDFKYYDTESSTFNEFTSNDYNKINKIARANLSKKIQSSTLKTNAKNRLISELSKILILTNSMGWKLQYQGNTIDKDSDFKLINHSTFQLGLNNLFVFEKI